MFHAEKSITFDIDLLKSSNETNLCQNSKDFTQKKDTMYHVQLYRNNISNKLEIDQRREFGFIINFQRIKCNF